MGIIGNNVLVGGAYGEVASESQKLLQDASYVYTPAAPEQVHQVSVYVTTTAGGELEVGVYDITGGVGSATLVGSFSVVTTTSGAWNTFTVPSPWQISAGNTYAIAWRAVSEVDMTRSYLAGAVNREATLTGANALPASWSLGADLAQHYSIYAETQATATTPTIRKSSTFDIETTLGTITTATLNGVNVFDHVTGQVGTTVSFAGLATDEITTSGEYSLVLGDGATTETIAVQVNAYGVAPSNNPVQKDGAALASLTGVQVRVTNGANINGSELYYSGTATTDASGNLGNIDLSSTAAADTDPVLLHLRTSAGDSIIASETVGLI